MCSLLRGKDILSGKIIHALNYLPPYEGPCLEKEFAPSERKFFLTEATPGYIHFAYSDILFQKLGLSEAKCCHLC